MNGDKKNIDQYFRDSSLGYRVSPSPGTWEVIGKRFFGSGLAWVRGTSIAVILLGMGLATYFFLSAGSQSPIPATKASGTGDPLHSIDPAAGDETVKLTTSTAMSEVPQGPSASGKGSATSLKTDDATAPSRSLLTEAGNPPVMEDINESIEITPAESAAFLPYTIEPITSGWLHQAASLLEAENRELRESDIVHMFRDSYVKKAELGFGVHVTPSVMFYDPNPNKNALMGEATLNYNSGRWTVRAGAGVNYVKDAGIYDVHFRSYDSIGYYNEVTSFRFAEGNDSLIIELQKTTVYDSVAHVTLKELNNTYTYLYFPVNVSYRFWEKGRVSVDLSTGLSYSLLVSRNEPTIEWTADDADLVRIDRIVPARVKSNWLWSAGISFGYQLSSKITLNVEPVYYLYLNDIYIESEDWPGKRPYTAGIRAGIDFHF